MYHYCPVCNEYIYIETSKSVSCSSCKSILAEDSHKQIQIISNGLKFNWGNIGIALILIGFFVFLIFRFGFGDNSDILFVGLLSFGIPLFAMFKHFASEYYRFNSIFGLYRAIFDKRIKYYDFGSKFTIVSIICIQIMGLVLILIGIIK